MPSTRRGHAEQTRSCSGKSVWNLAELDRKAIFVWEAAILINSYRGIYRPLTNRDKAEDWLMGRSNFSGTYCFRNLSWLFLWENKILRKETRDSSETRGLTGEGFLWQEVRSVPDKSAASDVSAPLPPRGSQSKETLCGVGDARHARLPLRQGPSSGAEHLCSYAPGRASVCKARVPGAVGHRGEKTAGELGWCDWRGRPPPPKISPNQLCRSAWPAIQLFWAGRQCNPSY